MRQVIHQAPIYEHVLESYEAETYVKGRTHVPRKNKLLRYAYLVFPVERHPCDALFEMSGLTRYDAPNHYRNKIVAINSSHLAAGRHYKEIDVYKRQMERTAAPAITLTLYTFVTAITPIFSP